MPNIDTSTLTNDEFNAVIVAAQSLAKLRKANPSLTKVAYMEDYLREIYEAMVADRNG